MFKNLSPSVLGISGRQSELIELALTYSFRSLEVDIDAFVKKAEKQSVEHAARFLVSGQLKLGSFELPIQWRGAEEEYQSELGQLDVVAQVAAAAGGTVCHTSIVPASDALPYHDNFELHRKRLTELADGLGKHGIQLGLSLQPLPSYREGKEFQFIFEAEGMIALIRSISAENVGLYLDSWNWYFGGGTAEQLQALGGQQIVGLTVADAPQDVGVDDVDETQRLLPGDGGAIDTIGLVKQLYEQGVRGPITLAPSPGCLSGQAREAIVQRCNQILDGLLKDAEVLPSAKPSPALAP